MIRSSHALLVVMVAVFSTAGCAPLRCGPGTKQLQAANGDVECVPADGSAIGGVPCNVDGGLVEIEGGGCNSRVKCDPASTMYDPSTGICVGTSTGKANCPVCTPPGTGQICVSGGVVEFETGMHLMAGGRPLRFAAFEPLALLANPASAPLAEAPSSTDACYTFTMAAPQSGLVAIAVTDPTTGAPAGLLPLAIGGAGASVTAGNVYHLDAVMATQRRLADWSTQGGEDFTGKGAYVACYYADPPSAPTDQLLHETMPVSGVTLLESQAASTTTRYLAPDRSIGSGLTTTTGLGCAVVPAVGINVFGGQGGPGTSPMVTKFESQPGGTAAGVLFLSRFHSCDASAGASTCQ